MSGKTKETGEKQIRAKAAPKAGKSAAKTKIASAKSKPVSAKKKATGPDTKATGSKTKTPAKKAGKPKTKAASAPAVGYRVGDPLVDPIGDVSGGEARFAAGAEAEPEAQAQVDAYRAETAAEAVDGTKEARPEAPAVSAGAELAASAHSEAEESAASGSAAGEDEPETNHQPGQEAKLERLQKILSQAGVASRRRAEEMIVAGRVMVNGQIVTQLGSKADPARDHIRVDGKLLHGAERHRYFVLNKPKGYVTTVSDPEGRPTVMEFFAKMRERLYPVGRLDYQSEGLLLMTNDGDLANRLSKAGSGVEKTYLVKVAGQPSEEELDRLRAGVAIERGEAGSGQVRTAPARIRQFREGDNPWYEVTLIEGRNRELRKMFMGQGHFVEKIRRVGYGPLVLDLEPGQFRELTADEVAALRLAAEGKLKPQLAQTVRGPGRGQPFRPTMAHKPPKGAGYAAGERFAKRPAARGEKPWRKEQGSRERGEREPRERRFDGSAEHQRPHGDARSGLHRPQGERTNASPKSGKLQGERFGGQSKFERPGKDRTAGKPGQFGARPERGRSFGGRPGPGQGTRFERPGFAARPRPRDEEPSFEETPRRPFRPQDERPAIQRPEEPAKRFGKGPGKDRAGRPGRAWNKGAGKGWNKEGGRRTGKPEGSAPAFRGAAKPGGFSKSGLQGQPGGARFGSARSSGARFGSARSGGAKPGSFSKSGYKGRPAGAGRAGPRPAGKRQSGKKRG